MKAVCKRQLGNLHSRLRGATRLMPMPPTAMAAMIGGQSLLSKSKFGDPLEKAELGEDQEIDVGAGNKEDALPAFEWDGECGCCARFSSHARAILCAGRSIESPRM